MRNRRTDRPSGVVPFRLWAPARFRAAVSIVAATAAGFVPATAVLPRAAYAAVVPTVSVGPALDVAEGDTLRFPLTLSEPSDGSTTVQVSTTETGTASSSSDFTPRTEFEVTFASGQTTAVAEVPTVVDSDVEASPETVALELVNPVNATLGDASASGKIVDVVISVDPVGAITEGDAPVRTQSFDINLNVAHQNEVQLTYAVGNGTASAGAEFTGIPETVLVFAPGEVTKRIDVTIRGDAVYRGADRNFTMNLSGFTGGNATGLETRTFTILDDETLPTVNAVTGQEVQEGSNGSTTVTFTVTLSNPTEDTVILPLTGKDGTAVQEAGAVGGFDYDVPDTVSFAPNQASATFDVTVTGDTVFEENETASIVITPQDGDPSVTGPPQEAAMTIFDDDAAPAFTFDGFEVGEDGPGAGVAFTVTGDAQKSYPWTATVGGVIDGQTVHATDADLHREGLVLSGVLAPGDDRIDLGTLDAVTDTTDEFDEKVKVALDVEGLPSPVGLGTIQDSGSELAPELALPQSVIRVNEGESVTIPATMDFAGADGSTALSTEKDVTVDWVASPGEAQANLDYSVVSGSLIFDDSSHRENIVIPIEQDPEAEGEETFTVTLQNPVNASLPGQTVTVAINGTPPTVNVDGPRPVGEGGVLRFPITLSEPAVFPITVRVGTTGGTATSGTDYYPLTNHDVLFNPGETRAFVDVLTIPDGEFESQLEWVSLTITDRGQAVLGTDLQMGDIVDPVISVNRHSGDIVEGDSGTHNHVFEARLSMPMDSTVSVNYAVVPGTAVAGEDFDATGPTQLIFEPGQTVKLFEVPVHGDDIGEGANQTFRIVLSDVSGANLGSMSDYTFNIIDDDEAQGPPTVSIGSAGVTAEGRPLHFPLTLSRPSDSPVTVRFSTGTGPATAGADYVAATDTEVTFQPGETTATAVVTTNTDNDFEFHSETVTVDITDPGTAVLGTASANGHIVDPVILIGAVAFGEASADSVSVDMKLSLQLDAEVRADYEVLYGSKSTNTFTPLSSGVLTYQPGATTDRIVAQLPGGYHAGDGDKEFRVRLFNVSMASGLAVQGEGLHHFPPAGAVPGAVPHIAAVSATPQHEGSGRAVVTVYLSGPATAPITLDVSGADGTAVQGGNGAGSADYSVPGQVTIQPGDVQAAFEVTINDDAVFEKDERAEIVVTPRSGDLNVTGPAQRTALVVYNDDNAPTVTFDGFDQAEGAGGVGVGFTVTGDAQDPLPWTAAVQGAMDSNGEPAEETDFDPAGLILSGTLEPGGDRISLGTVNYLADNTDEFDETIMASVRVEGLNEASGFGVVRDGATDLPPKLVAPAEVPVMEGELATVPFQLDFAAVPGNTATRTEKTVTADYDPTSATAEEGSDFTAESSTLHIDPPGTSTEIYVTVPEDHTAEADETLTVELTNPVNAVLERTSSTVRIKEHAPTVSIGYPADTIGGRPLSFPLTLDRPSAYPITVRFSTRDDGSATPGVDYTPVKDATVTFPAGATTAYALVPTFDDGVYDFEYGEVHVEINDAGIATVGTSTATGIIAEAEIAVAATAPIDEGASGVRAHLVDIRLRAPLDAEVRVDYSLVAGTAAEGVDYDPVSGHLVFAPGETVKQIQVPIRGDETPESLNKTFNVRLTNLTHAGGVTVAGAGDHPITIREDDNSAAPSITSVTAAPRPEGDGTSTAAFTVQLSGPVSARTTLHVSGGGTASATGDAIGGSDYSIPGSVTVDPGADTATINVTVNGDAVYEPDEVIEILVEPAPDDALMTWSETSGSLTLLNDDAAPKISFDGFEQSEGTGGISASFTVTGDAQAPLPWTAIVQGASNGGSDPAEATDFTTAGLILSGTLQPGGDRIDVGRVDLTTDSADEYDETVKVSVDVAGSGNVTGFGTILDSPTQAPPKVVPVGQVTATEAGTAMVPVTLDFAAAPGNTATSTEKLVTVDYTTTAGTAAAGADFAVTTGTLVFTPPSTTENISIPISADALDETDETLSVTLNNPSNAEIGGTPTTVTIRGVSTPVPAFRVTPDVTVTEGEVTAAEVTVTLADVAAGPVDFAISPAEGTARLGGTGPGNNDYGPPSPMVTIPQGQTSATVKVPIVDDQVFENKEYAKVTVALAAGEIDASGTAQQSTLTVLDDDPAPTITLNSVNGVEGGTADVIATPSGVAQDPIAYLLSVKSGAAFAGDSAEPDDYVDSGAPAVLPGGSTGQVLLRSIPLAADTVDELTESFTVTATSQATPEAPGVAAVYGILDDPSDLPPSAVVLPANVSEDAGVAEVPVGLEFVGGNGATRTEQTVSVFYEVVPGTATGVDFGAPIGGSPLVFPAGQTYSIIRVPIENDRRIEKDETFQVRLVGASPWGGIGRESSDVVIADDDQNLPRPAFAVTGDVTAREGDTATVTVTLSEPAQGDVDLTVETQPGTATPAGNREGESDYDAPPVALRIPEGSLSATVTVATRQDAVYEGDESARIAVSLAAGELDAAGAAQQGMLTITDDDTAPAVTLDPATSTVAEGDTVELTGTVRGVAQRDFPVDMVAAARAAAEGDAAGPDDYEFEKTPVTVPGGTPSGTKFRLGTIRFRDDSVDEDGEVATVSIGGTTLTFRLTDDPADMPPAVSIEDVSVGESDGTAELIVSLEFNGGATSTSRTVTVPWQTSDGTADAGKDYTKSAGTATIEPLGDSATITVPILPDTRDEAEQDFTVKLGRPSPADVQVTDAVGEVAIEDDDKAKAPTLTVPSGKLNAGRITISGTAAAATKVELLTAPGVSGGTFKVVATAQADDDGAYSFRPNFAHGYRVMTRAAGVSSPVRTIQLAQEPQLTAVSNAKGAATLTVTGDPDEPGQKVTIQRQVKGGWDEVADGKLNADGKFTTTERSLKSGNNVFRAVISATPSLGILAGTTPARTVKVK